jgi:hypothetical protein
VFDVNKEPAPEQQPAAAKPPEPEAPSIVSKWTLVDYDDEKEQKAAEYAPRSYLGHYVPMLQALLHRPSWGLPGKVLDSSVRSQRCCCAVRMQSEVSQVQGEEP